MKALTEQEIFDKVASHLLTQNAKSTVNSPGGTARLAYRGDDGRKCAIGALIPDSLYNPNMEGRAISGLIRCCPTMMAKSGLFVGQEFILEPLQFLHDHIPVEKWRESLSTFALDHSLNDDVLRR